MYSVTVNVQCVYRYDSFVKNPKKLLFLAPTGALGVKMLSVRGSVRDIVQISTLEEFLRAKGPIERAQREGIKRGHKRGHKERA